MLRSGDYFMRSKSLLPGLLIAFEGIDGAGNRHGLGVFRVILQGEASGIAGGQFAVFYKGKECLGAGIIS